MISSFGRGFDSLQLHLKTNESSDYQSFFFLWVFSLIPLFIVDLLFFLFLDLKSASNLNGNLNCSKELEHYAS